MSRSDRERVADAIAAMTATDSAAVERDATELVESCGATLIGSLRVVDLLWAFGDALPAGPGSHVGTRNEASRLAHALESAVLDARGPEGGCSLGPALLALATHLTGRTPHHRPDALGATPTTVAASAEVLGWALSPDPTQRLVAALTAPARTLVDPLLHDPDVLVRTAAAMNRSRGADAREARYETGAGARDAGPTVGGVAALAMMRRVFEPAGLVVPEIAVRFARAGRLRHFDDWHYASARLPDPFEDYRFTTSADRLLGPVQEQLAISHAGHGINSYALNLRLAVGPVAVMTQVGWGGAYGSEEDDEEWSTLVEGVDDLTRSIALADEPRLERRRWLVVHSPLRMDGLPLLLRRDGDRLVVPGELRDEDRDDDAPPLRDPVEVRHRWRTIRDLVEQDLHLHERVWRRTAGIDVTVPDPRDPQPSSALAAVVAPDGSVVRLEFDAHDDLLERRAGVWERRDDTVRDRRSDFGGPMWVRHVPIGPEVVPRYDAAELAGLRLQLTALVGQDDTALSA